MGSPTFPRRYTNSKKYAKDSGNEVSMSSHFKGKGLHFHCKTIYQFSQLSQCFNADSSKNI